MDVELRWYSPVVKLLVEEADLRLACLLNAALK